MLRPRFIAAGVLVVLAAVLAVYSAVAPNPRTKRIEAQVDQALADRSRHIEPAELLDVMHDNQMQLVILDVRDEADYNLFHIIDSRRLPPSQWSASWMKQLPTDSVKVLISNDERRAEEAFRQLALEDVPHLYILAGGVNHWLEVFGNGKYMPISAPAAKHDDTLRYQFTMAVGSRQPAADPHLPHGQQLAFVRKVQPPKPVVKMSGGCGG